MATRYPHDSCQGDTDETTECNKNENDLPYSTRENIPPENISDNSKKSSETRTFLTPNSDGDPDDRTKEAKALPQMFFYDFLWRHWDDEEDCYEYTGLIEKRLQLYSDIQDGTVPDPVSKRYLKTLEEYHSKRLHLTKFQTNCGLLKFWENLRLRNHGLFYPRVYKRRKGHRASGKKVTHIVAQVMTADMIKNFPSDTLIQQHESLEGALESCFSGDSVLICPGEYQANGLASLTDDILIRGSGKRQEVAIISDPSHDYFVASKGSHVTLQDLTLIQRGTCDGIVVAESGHMTLENCLLKCEGTGVCVLTGASLNMTSCEITGAQGAGIEVYPGSVAELHRNEIHHCSSQASTDIRSSVGGINMKVLPQPQLKMSDNYIHDNHGYGVTILVPDHLQGQASESQEPTGDKNETTAIQKLSMDISNNKLESNSLGKVGVLHKMWENS